MARNNGLYSGAAIAVAAMTLAVSPRARHLVRNGVTSAVSGAFKVGTIVARGTRNLQEEQKHVTRFGVETGDAGVTDTAANAPPPTGPSSS